MRGDVPACVVKVPGSLQEALAALAQEPWRPLAGGTDLMVPFAAGRLADTRFLSLQRLEDLRAIEADVMAEIEALIGGALRVQNRSEQLRRYPGGNS